MELSPKQESDMQRKGYKDPIKYLAYVEREKQRAKLRYKGESIPKELLAITRLEEPMGGMERALIRNYGITLEEYDRLFFLQSGRCAICGGEETSTIKGVVKRLSVDHCHDTGRIRGLLCNSCNRGIGLLKDSVEVLSSAIEYLKGV